MTVTPARFGMSPLDQMTDAGVLARALGGVGRARARQVPAAVSVLAASAVMAAGLSLLSPSVRVLPLLLAIGFVVLAGLGLSTPVGGRFGWLVPALMRVGEYGFVTATVSVMAPDALPAAFALLCVAAYHHYDTVYRLRQTGHGPALWLPLFSLGADGRMLAVGLVLLVTDAAAGIALGWLSGVLAVVILAESLTGWYRWLASRPAVGEEDG